MRSIDVFFNEVERVIGVMGKRAALRSMSLGTVAAIVFVAGCGGSDEESGGASSSGKEAVKVALLQQGLYEYARVNLDGAREVTAKDGRASVDLLSADFDPQKQLRQCRDAITKGYKVLLIYPVAGGSIAPCVRDAKDAGVVVGSLDSPLGPNYTSTAIQLPGVVTQVMAPIVDDGRAAAEMTLKACADKDPCNVVLSVGDPANSYSTEKLKAEKESLAKHPQIKILGTPVAGFADPAKGYAAGRDILTANPDVDVIVGDTDATVRGIERAVKEAGKLGKIQLIGDGASQYAADAIADGRWFGSVIYMPRTSAAKATDLLIRAARGEKVPSVVTVEQLSPTKGMELTKAELSQFKPEYKGE